MLVPQVISLGRDLRSALDLFESDLVAVRRKAASAY